jgi:hypothetical protein
MTLRDEVASVKRRKAAQIAAHDRTSSVFSSVALQARTRTSSAPAAPERDMNARRPWTT